MVTWNNLDTLTSYAKLKDLKDHVDIKEAMTGENGAKRVAEYSAPMASGLSFNYAAKQVDDEVLDVLAELADEHQLVDKFEELYNGAIINTGEQRLVLHHLARRQLGKDVIVDGVNKRDFYVEQLTLQTKYMLVRSQMKLVKHSLQLFRSVSVVVI